MENNKQEFEMGQAQSQQEVEMQMAKSQQEKSDSSRQKTIRPNAGDLNTAEIQRANKKINTKNAIYIVLTIAAILTLVVTWTVTYSKVDDAKFEAEYGVKNYDSLVLDTSDVRAELVDPSELTVAGLDYTENDEEYFEEYNVYRVWVKTENYGTSDASEYSVSMWPTYQDGLATTDYQYASSTGADADSYNFITVPAGQEGYIYRMMAVKKGVKSIELEITDDYSDDEATSIVTVDLPQE